MSGKLSTHVLDNYFGRPAEGVPWTLSVLEGNGSWTRISSGQTNAEGRTDAPLLIGESLKTARYRLSFDCVPYYLSHGVTLSNPPFLDHIALEVNLCAGQNYHVPLLMTPWSYSTYRGS